MNRDDRERRFIEAVRQRRNGMYRVALSMLRSPQDAEDAVSAAVEAAWNRLDHLRNLDALPTYLMRCAVNSSRSLLKRRKRESAAEDVSLLLPPVSDEPPVWELLCGLPERYRLPLILRYAEGMTLAETAEALGLTRSGASSRVQRGLRILRAQMEEGTSRE